VLSKQLALLEILQNNPGEGEESRLQVRMAIEQAVYITKKRKKIMDEDPDMLKIDMSLTHSCVHNDSGEIF
jgi:hypothetical protein